MVILPSWMVKYVFLFPGIITVLIGIVFIGCLFSTVFVMFQKNRFVNNFMKHTRIEHTHASTVMFISTIVSLCGLIAGVPPGHVVQVLWYTLMNVFAFLYVLYVVDYYILKSEGLVDED